MSRCAQIVILLLTPACSGSDRLAAPPELSAGRVGRHDFVVHAGGSIQAAVNAAGPGSVIRIEPGTYREAVHVAVPGLKLMGLHGKGGRGAIIENPGTEANGVTVDPGSDGFALVDVTVRGFRENGVYLTG